MLDSTLKVLAVIGSLHRESVTCVVIQQCCLINWRPEVVQWTFSISSTNCSRFTIPIPPMPLLLIPAGCATRVEQADAILLGTPDYHGSISGATKNFLDHFWHEFAGKLFVTLVASHEKGLTATDQIRTVARQCYAWTLPYGVSFVEGEDVERRPDHQ